MQAAGSAPTVASAREATDVLILGIAAFGSSAMMRVCDPMLPELTRVFDVSTGQAARTVSMYAVAYGLFQLVYGPLGDRFGKWRVVALASLACVVGNVLAMFSMSLDNLIVARSLAGAAAAGIIPMALAWIGDAVPYERRQAVLARFLTATLTGMIAGQFLSGLVIETVGWRWVFGGLALLFLSSGLLLWLRGRVGQQPAVTTRRGYLNGLGEVLGSAWACLVLLLVTLEGAAAFAAIAFLPAFLHVTFALSLPVAAAIVSAYGLGGLAYSFGVKRFLVALGEPGLALTGGVLLGLSWLVIAAASHWLVALPACFAGGLGYYMLHNTLTTHATQMAPAVRGTAVSLFACALFIGISCGVAVAGMVIDRTGYRQVFAACGVALIVIGACFARSLVRRRADAIAPGIG